MTKGCLTVEEAARLSGLPESQIRQLCRDGQLPTHNRASGQGEPWLIPPRVLVMYLEKQGLPVNEELLAATGRVAFR